MATSIISFPFLFVFLPNLVHSLTNDFVFNGFRGVTNVSLDGSSLITSNGALQLTNDTKYVMGHAFYNSSFHMFNNPTNTTATASSFSTAFVFAIVTPLGGAGGDGMAFMLYPMKKLPGAQFANYLGLFGLTNNGNFSNHVFAIEFDTVQGAGLFQDINENHVGIDINSAASNASKTASYYNDKTKQMEKMELESGEPIQAWIAYDGVENIVNVTISPLSVPKPSRPLLSHSIDLSPILKESMYVGFSSATGKLKSYHYVLGWSFQMNGLASPLDLSRLPSLPKVGKASSGVGTKGSIEIGVATSVTTLLLLVLVISTSLYLLHRAKLAEVLEDWEMECTRRFSYKDLYTATKGFKESEVLGSGGFGRVYKGILPVTKQEVAIKRISHNSRQGVREFAAEIESLGRLTHRNLVHLQGWCKRKGDLLLVYDFMPNGSLDTFLYSQNNLTISWENRYKILKGIASGLLYLHEEWEKLVIHRDVKASNILLDADMNGRLGDFGLARLYEHGKNPRTTHIVGTLGYIAPEVSRFGKPTASSDVFSYGALLLEVACGRAPIEPNASSQRLLLLDWVWECWVNGQILQVADPKLEGEYVVDEMELVLKLGILCSQSTPEARPTMRQVLRFLDRDEHFPDLNGVSPAIHLDGSSTDSVLHSNITSFGTFTSGSLKSGR